MAAVNYYDVGLIDSKGKAKNTFRRCWVDISLNQLLKNLQLCKLLLEKPIMAIVKADAYGHGDKQVSLCLNNNGIQHFAVSNIDEAVHLRDAGVIGQILILGYTPIDRIQDLINFDVTQTIISLEYADRLVATNLPIKCEFAIDTGMRRIGLNADDLDECERAIRKYNNSNLQLDGLFTHLCVADTPKQDKFTDIQIKLFEEICDRVSDLKLPYCHCMNSAGGLWHHSKTSCFTRLGIVLYGLKPDFMNKLPDGIEPVLSWKSVVSMVKRVKPGDTVGYGRSYYVESPMTIATIPTGYADGYPRGLSNKGWVLINGHKAPIVGRICMDQMMVDVTSIPDVTFETEVVLIGRSGDEIITADDLASLTETIGYEIVCGISKRVERVYID